MIKLVDMVNSDSQVNRQIKQKENSKRDLLCIWGFNIQSKYQGRLYLTFFLNRCQLTMASGPNPGNQRAFDYLLSIAAFALQRQG